MSVTRLDPDSRAAVQSTARAILSPVPSVVELAIFNLRAQLGLLPVMDRLAAWAEIRHQAQREVAALASAVAAKESAICTTALDTDLWAEQQVAVRSIMKHPDPDGDAQPVLSIGTGQDGA